ncbi:hypothetical protein [Kineococcus sp. SYSU DK003]|uniref:hypothetical protein n=1 Tax=Kineococcus sp. SYSU DK003 TaxID=3383124 RepID=UPI003D7E84C4
MATAAGEPSREAGTEKPSDVPTDAALAFEVRYADDEPYRFEDGSRRRFGREDRDEDAITIWEQIHDQHLSKVAGELWCADGQMWVRNLSQAHELVIDGSGSATLVLPSRTPDHPGFACSIPWPKGTVRAPSTGSWQLDVTALPTEAARSPSPAEEVAQDALQDVPRPLQAVARALCAPLLRGQPRPATAREVATSLGITEGQAARGIDSLCAHRLDRNGRGTGKGGDGDLDDPTARIARVARDLLTSPLFATVRVDDVPAAHRDVAQAWCAPLLAGGSLPASYAEIAAALNITARTARRRVEELTDRYSAQVLALPGGLRPGETLSTATARLLVHRGKVRRA